MRIELPNAIPAPIGKLRWRGNVLTWMLMVLALHNGCATMTPLTTQNPPQTAQEQAREIEPILDTAGFEALRASNAAQMNRLRALPALKLGYYRDQGGAPKYWMADPDYCGCLFYGDEVAYQRYGRLKKDNRTAEIDRQTLQAQHPQQPFVPSGPPGFGPGMGFGFGPGTGFSGGFGFSL